MRNTMCATSVLLLAWGSAAASLFVKLDLPDLARQADRGIVRGTVLSTESYWNAERTMIFTDVHVRVLEDLAGIERPGQTLVFRVPGGHVAPLQVRMEGTPRFEAGDEVLIFASAWSDGPLMVVGYFQGLSTIRTGASGERLLQGGTAAGRALDDVRGIVRELGATAARAASAARSPIELVEPPEIETVLDYPWLDPLRRFFPADLPVKMNVDWRGIGSINDHDRGMTAGLRAIENWEVAGVGDLVRPIKGGPVGPHQLVPFTAGDGLSVLRFDAQVGVCPAGCVGATVITSFDDAQSGECGGRTYARVLEADVVVNAQNNQQFTSVEEATLEGGCTNLGWPGGEHFIEHVAAHELGHVLGLAHMTNPDAVMGPAMVCEQNKTHLHPDDVASVQQGYACAFSQGGVFADSDGDGSGQDVDCDDQNASAYPGAPELCDLRDNDCDGSADEGLECAAACLVAANGPAELRIEKGACAAAASVPGFRDVFVRGSLVDMRAAGGVSHVSVEVLSCPTLYVYDRTGEAAPVSVGSGWFYLVRDIATSNYGNDSSGTPRTPTEIACP